VKIERFWPRAAVAPAIIALVLITNEGYRHVRGLVDTVNQSKQDIALLKRDLYVLQVQLDNGPGPVPGAAVAAPVSFATAAPATSAAPAGYPMPVPGPMALPLPESPARPRLKAAQPTDEPKSLVSVVLMSEEKAHATLGATVTRSADSPTMDVKLIGDAK